MSRWESAFADGEWLALDLGSVRQLCAANIYWEGAHAEEYWLQVGEEGGDGEVVWRNVTHEYASGAGWVWSPLPSGTSARYFRVWCHSRAP